MNLIRRSLETVYPIGCASLEHIPTIRQPRQEHGLAQVTALVERDWVLQPMEKHCCFQQAWLSISLC